MRLFQRIGDIVAANLSDLVERFEDPEVMLKQAIREMETMIERATGAAARAIAAERMLARDLSDHERHARRWYDRAEEAVVHGNDDLARKAIARAHEHEAMAQALAVEGCASEQTSQTLRVQISAMWAKHAEATRNVASLSARRQIAANGRAVHGLACTYSSGTSGFARYERMRKQIEHADVEAELLADLGNAVGWGFEAEAESRQRARRVEAELNTLKERHNPVQKPAE
jgi:phage shock protein A